MRSTYFTFVVLFVAAWALGGCSGSGEGLDANGRPIGEDPGGPLTASFGSIQAHVFTPICTACHAGANAPQGLRLDVANSYNLLVGVPSAEVPPVLRVKPGDPNNSYIIQKLEGTAAVGAQMPFGGPPLPAETIAVIRQWIADGALAEAASVSAAELKLTSIVPADGDVVNEPLRQVVLGFTRELDATRADATAVRLERVDPTDPESDAMVVPTEVTVPDANPLALLLTSSQPLSAGHYRIVVDESAGGGLRGLDGQRLKGFSSTEGVLSVFTVERPQ